MSSPDDVKASYPPDTGVRVGIVSGSQVLVSGVPVDCGFLSPNFPEGAPVALLRWKGAWLALGTTQATLPVPEQIVAATGSITLTVTPALITGATITITAPQEGVSYHAVGVFDTLISVAGSGAGVGYLYIDGVQQAGIALFQATSSVARATVSQQWFGTLSAGSHTFELYGSLSAATSTVSHRIANTTLSVRLGA